MTIRRIAGGKFRVYARKSGRNMGTYRSRAGALERERQIEYFKRHHARRRRG